MLAGPVTGGCLCGAVRYRVGEAGYFRPYACHCVDCQTRTGSAFGLQLAVLSGDLAVEGPVIEGEHVQPSGARAGIVACARCLTRLYTTNDRRPGIVNLRAGTLDRSREIDPAFHLWTDSKLAWITLPDEAVTLATQPSSAEEWQRLMVVGG